jgi:NADPH:quinone reductase-like Zn-dependent oxidoreductase
VKAWSIERRGDVSQLKQTDVADPIVEPDSLLVEVKGASLNSADIKVLSGRNGGRFLHSNRFPLRMGFDYAGTVRAVGSNVREWRAGQDVYGFLAYSTKTTQGSFADLVQVLPSETAGKPKNVDFPEAASLATVSCTALQAFRDKGHLKPGQSVLINGASGGVGACGIQIAKAMGAKVWGTSSAEKMSELSKWGADEVVDYRKTPVSQINAKFDVILDAAATSSFTECAPKLNSGGAYVTLVPGPWSGSLRRCFRRNPAPFSPCSPRRTISVRSHGGRKKDGLFLR